MSAPTKMRHTETMMDFTVLCPAAAYSAAQEFLRNLGCTIEDNDPDVPTDSPGVHLPGYRTRDNLTQAELARLVEIPARHISEMENNRHRQEECGKACRFFQYRRQHVPVRIKQEICSYQ